MADFVFNVAKGRVAELYNRVQTNDPSTSALLIIAVNASTAQATLEDYDDLAAVLGDAGVDEVTNTGYARIVLTDTELSALAQDDTNNRMPVDTPDQTWSSVAAGDNWTHLIFAYDSDTGGGTDANIVPLTMHDFPITTDGSDITVEISDFYRAS